MIKITFGLIDSTLETDGKVVTSNNLSEYAIAGDILEEKDTVNLATFENNYLLLDGNFVFPQPEIEYSIGYETQTIASGNEYIDIEFDDLHSLYGFIMRFKEDEYFVNFNVLFYNGDNLLDTVSVRDNSETLYQKIITILNFNKVRINILSVLNGRRARLRSLILGISQVYDENVLLEVNATKTTDLLAENSDNGTIEFSFYNTGGFNIKDISDLPEGVQKGVSIDFYKDDVIFNKYKSTETSIEEEGKIFNIVGNDLLYQLNQSYYNKGVVYESGRTLYQIAQDVASDCGINIVIDDYYSTITSYGYISEVSHREAFRMIAEAGMGSINVINGVLNLQKIIIFNEENLTNDDIEYGTFNVSNKNKVDGLIVYGYNYSKSNDLVGLAEARDILLTGENQTIYIEYSSKPAIKYSVAVNNCTIVDANYYSEHAEITIVGNANDLAWITITGYVYNAANTKITKGLESNAKEIKNTLISNPNNVADFQWNKLKGAYDYSLNAVADVELNDKVVYGDDNFYITKIDYTKNADDEIIILEGSE